MPRARNIKPGFFDNSELGVLPSEIRLLYIALWTLADREGVLEYDVLAIKRYVFGYNQEITEKDVNRYLTVISRLDNDQSVSIRNYDGKKYIILHKFPNHQNPHHTEKKGRLPHLNMLLNSVSDDLTVISPLCNGENPADSLIPDSLIPDSYYKVEFFENFKKSFPLNKRNFGSVKKAKEAFKVALGKDSLENIMMGVKNYENYIRITGQSNADAFRWLQNERWRDDYSVGNTGAADNGSKYQRSLEAAARGHEWAKNPDF